MSWPLVFLAIPFVVFALGLRRVVGVVKLFRDPDQLRSLLSEPVRAAIRDAGLDPDTIEMEDLEGREELAQRIAADLKRELQSRIFGFRLPGATPSPVPSAGASPRAEASTVSMEAWSSGPASTGATPARPPSIDAASGSGMRASTAFVIVAIAVAVAFFLLRAP